MIVCSQEEVHHTTTAAVALSVPDSSSKPNDADCKDKTDIKTVCNSILSWGLQPRPVYNSPEYLVSYMEHACRYVYSEVKNVLLQLANA